MFLNTEENLRHRDYLYSMRVKTVTRARGLHEFFATNLSVLAGDNTYDNLIVDTIYHEYSVVRQLSDSELNLDSDSELVYSTLT